MKNGFVVPGETTEDGLKIEIEKGHINNLVTIDGVEKKKIRQCDFHQS